MKNLTVLFVIVDGFITWLFWWGIAIANQYGYLKYGTPLMMVLYLLGGNSESIMAVILLLVTKQMTGKELFRKLCGFYQPLRFYFLVFTMLFISFGIPVVMGSVTFIAPFYMAILSLPAMVIGGGLEEVWWRFIVQPYFERKTNFTLATLITGSMWALWHLPLFFIQGTGQYNTYNFFAFVIVVMGLAFILAAIYKLTGSIWLCILFHTAWNSIGSWIDLEMDFLSSSVASIVLILISYILIMAYKKNVTAKVTKR
jgi:membrane protease YdiL (CAAX protease family)